MSKTTGPLYLHTSPYPDLAKHEATDEPLLSGTLAGTSGYDPSMHLAGDLASGEWKPIWRRLDATDQPLWQLVGYKHRHTGAIVRGTR